MSHAPRRDQLIDLALGLLEPEQALALEAHAAGCPACAEELAALRQTRALVAALPPVEPPEAGARALVAAARQEAERAAARRPAPRAAPRWLWGGTLGLAGAAAVAVLLLRVVPAPTGPGEPEPGPVGGAASGAVAVSPQPQGLASPARAEPRRVPAPVAADREVARATPGPAARAKASAAREAKVELAESGGARLAGAAGARPAAPSAALPAAPAMAAAEATLAADALGPPCPLEQRRRLVRDGAGRVVGRIREGRYREAGTEAPLVVEERFGPDGRLLGATVTVGGRRFTIGDEAVEAGRLEPLPGVVLAPTAAEAERAPRRCEP
jgi:anti-sigma factor RsiW